MHYVVDMLDQIVRTGYKNKDYPGQRGGSAMIIRNDIYYTSNIYLVNRANEQLLFLAFDNPNFMITSNKKACKVMSTWYQNLRQDCTPLTGNNEIIRNKFFNSLREKIDIIE